MDVLGAVPVPEACTDVLTLILWLLLELILTLLLSLLLVEGGELDELPTSEPGTTWVRPTTTVTGWDEDPRVVSKTRGRDPVGCEAWVVAASAAVVIAAIVHRISINSMSDKRPLLRIDLTWEDSWAPVLSGYPRSLQSLLILSQHPGVPGLLWRWQYMRFKLSSCDHLV